MVELRRVLRRAGVPRGSEEFQGLARWALGEVLRVAEPVEAHRELEVLEVNENGVLLEGLFIPSRRLAVHFSGAVRASLMLVSLGPGPSELQGELWEKGEYLKALFVDAAASELVEEALRDLDARLREERAGLLVGSARFAPGYADFPLELQGPILGLLDAERLGVSLSPEGMLIPEKSTTALVGWKPCGRK